MDERGLTVEDAYRKFAEDEEADRADELGPNYFTNLARRHGFLPPLPKGSGAEPSPAGSVGEGGAAASAPKSAPENTGEPS